MKQEKKGGPYQSDERQEMPSDLLPEPKQKLIDHKGKIHPTFNPDGYWMRFCDLINAGVLRLTTKRKNRQKLRG